MNQAIEYRKDMADNINQGSGEWISRVNIPKHKEAIRDEQMGFWVSGFNGTNLAER